jgi:hypothetical protein
MKSFEYEGCVYYEGDIVSCKIRNKHVKNAKLCIGSMHLITTLRWFLCQNNIKGAEIKECENPYKHSWVISRPKEEKPDFEEYEVSMISLVSRGNPNVNDQYEIF